MATTAVDKYFIDTNILMYVQLALSPWHAAAVAKLDDLDKAGAELWISRQVLREYLAAMTKPGLLTGSIPVASLLADVSYFASRFQLAEDGTHVMTHLIDLMNNVLLGGKQVHDANIVATMLAYGIPNLLTHNTADFARFASFITVVPLVP